MGIGSNLYAGSSAVGKINSYFCVCVTAIMVCSLLGVAGVALVSNRDFTDPTGKKSTNKYAVAGVATCVACCLCSCAAAYYMLVNNTKHGAAVVGAGSIWGLATS